MNNKMIMVMAVLVMATAFIGLSMEMEEQDGATYDARTLYNGGSGTITIPPQSVTINQSSSIQGIYCIAYPDSFTLSAGGSQTVTVYQTDGSYDDDYVTIVFQASSTVTYTVTISANNGGTVSGDTSFSVESGTSVSASGTTLHVGSHTAYASANNNYVFSGWSKTSGTITSNTTITASFSYSPPSPTFYNVTIVANTGGTVSGNTSFSVTSGTSIISNNSAINVGSYTAYASANTGYNFSGWSPSSGSITSNTTISANFTPISSTVTFDATTNGGTLSGSGSKTVTYGQTYGTLPTASKVYSTFTGWFTQATGGTQITSSSTVTITSNQTLYAQFMSDIVVSSVAPTTPSTAVITLSATGYTPSSASNGSTASLTIPPGTPVTFTASTVTGYTFHGWYDANDSTEGIDPDNPSVMTFTSSQTFNAEYYPISSTVTFDATTNGGTLSGSGSKTVTYGQTYGTLPTASKVYSTFTGWFTQATGGTQITSSSTVTITSNQTLYAQFMSDIVVSSVAPTTPSTAVITLSATGYTPSSASNGSTASLTIPPGTPVTFTASTVTGYTFHGWYDANDSTEGIDPDNPSVMTFTSSQTFNAEYQLARYTLTFDASTNGGTTPTSSKTVTYSQPIGTLPVATYNGHSFDGWFTQATGGTQITSDTIWTWTTDRTVYAQFTLLPVYWSNDLQNGSIDITFRFSNTNNMDHNMIIPLYSGVTDSQNVTTWTKTGDYLDITVSYADTVITVDLYDSTDTKLIPTSTTDLGHWSKFTLRINSDTGKITFIPIDRMENFTAFSTMDSQSRDLVNWSSVTNGNSMREIIHTETGTGGQPTFSVTNTDTFLNTYGVVMTNPSINVYDYFPQYDNVRLNLYAFAIYGDSMTINGNTFPVTNGSVTVYYTTSNKVNTIATPSTENVQEKTLTLSNIYVTWEDGRCSLTFVNDNFTVQLGDFSAGSETVSFDGYWYFTSYLYEPYTAHETVIDGDWDYLPDLSSPAIFLIMLGTLIIGGLIAHVKIGLKWLDMVIMICGVIFMYALLG